VSSFALCICLPVCKCACACVCASAHTSPWGGGCVCVCVRVCGRCRAVSRLSLQRVPKAFRHEDCPVLGKGIPGYWLVWPLHELSKAWKCWIPIVGLQLAAPGSSYAMCPSPRARSFSPCRRTRFTWCVTFAQPAGGPGFVVFRGVSTLIATVMMMLQRQCLACPTSALRPPSFHLFAARVPAQANAGTAC
jgi:hypothetical protein